MSIEEMEQFVLRAEAAATQGRRAMRSARICFSISLTAMVVCVVLAVLA